MIEAPVLANGIDASATLAACMTWALAEVVVLLLLLVPRGGKVIPLALG